MIHPKGSQGEIIIFTRFPEPGRSKTRLIPELGNEGAAIVQRTMTEQVVATARKVSINKNLHLSVYFTGGSYLQMQEWLGSDLFYHDQIGDDLGQRIMHAFHDARKRGATRAVLLGSDCPAVDSRLILEAMTTLETSQLVLGPTADGGYYLIGSSCDLPHSMLSLLLTDIAWGSDDVFQTTLVRARNAGMKVSILKELHDIDQPQDLEYFHYHSNP